MYVHVYSNIHNHIRLFIRLVEFDLSCPGNSIGRAPA